MKNMVRGGFFLIGILPKSSPLRVNGRMCVLSYVAGGRTQSFGAFQSIEQAEQFQEALILDFDL